MMRKKNLLCLVTLFLLSCGDKVTNIIAAPVVSNPGQGNNSSPAPQTQIIIAGGDTNHRGISSYTIDGVLTSQILDLKAFGSTPNGIAKGPGDNFLVSTDGADSILSVPYSSDYSFFYGSGLLNGGIYDIEYNPVLDYYYVVESANIEVFDSAGFRIPGARIPKTVGSCVLVAPRNTHITDDGVLYVADFTASRIHKYDISTPVATCLDSYTIPGTSPYAVIKHSNGLLYFTSFSDDAVYTYDESTNISTNIFDPGLTILRDPRGLAELPDGHVIVSSSIIDTIERIDATGVRQGISPFIRDVNSLNVTDIEVITR